MSNTPITDELAREFSGKRVSSREAGAVWSLCRDLERELNKVITALAQSKEANAGLMRACDKHERELADMTKQRDTLAEALSIIASDGKDQFQWSATKAIKLASEALAATKGGSDE
jgi:hypothetical protein